LEAIRERIASLRAELADLEQAAALLSRHYGNKETSNYNNENGPIRGHDSGTRPVTKPKSIPRREIQAETDEFAGVTIKDAAVEVLMDSGEEYLDYEVIAERAMRRGFRSTSFRNPENDPDKITRSFYSIMKGNPNVFIRDGRTFGLKQVTNEEDQ